MKVSIIVAGKAREFPLLHLQPHLCAASEAVAVGALLSTRRKPRESKPWPGAWLARMSRQYLDAGKRA